MCFTERKWKTFRKAKSKGKNKKSIVKIRKSTEKRFNWKLTRNWAKKKRNNVFESNGKLNEFRRKIVNSNCCERRLSDGKKGVTWPRTLMSNFPFVHADKVKTKRNQFERSQTVKLMLKSIIKKAVALMCVTCATLHRERKSTEEKQRKTNSMCRHRQTKSERNVWSFFLLFLLVYVAQLSIFSLLRFDNFKTSIESICRQINRFSKDNDKAKTTRKLTICHFDGRPNMYIFLLFIYWIRNDFSVETHTKEIECERRPPSPKYTKCNDEQKIGSGIYFKRRQNLSKTLKMKLLFFHGSACVVAWLRSVAVWHSLLSFGMMWGWFLSHIRPM